MTDTTTPVAAPAAADNADEPDDVRARAVKAMEEAEAAMPTPTQAELDQAKLGLGKDVEGGKAGAYKTRQTKAG